MKTSCIGSGDFAGYFKENMDALGLPTPTSLFDKYTTALATAMIASETLKSLGPKATLAELAGATNKLEKLRIASALGAAWYTGAVVGSIAVATGRILGCGARIADVLVVSHRVGLRDGHSFFAMHPEIWNDERSGRSNFHLKARIV